MLLELWDTVSELLTNPKHWTRHGQLLTSTVQRVPGFGGKSLNETSRNDYANVLA